MERRLHYREPMQQRFLGRTGLKVSRLGLGTLTWGRDTDEHEARDQLKSFVEAGGTLLDTAAGYGDGASEELIGELLGDVVAREDVVIATKAGVRRTRGAGSGRAREINVSRGNLVRTLDESLRRLGTDHVDLWQVHTWSDETPWEETLGALDHAVASGKALYVGVSNYSGWQSAQTATWQRAVPGRAVLASNQVEYSLLNRYAEAEIIPAAAALGMGVLAWSPASTVPGRRPTPARPPRTSPTSSGPTSTRGAPPSSRRSRGRPTGCSGPRRRWRSPGCGTVPGSARRSSVRGRLRS